MVKKQRRTTDEDEARWRKLQTFALIADAIVRVLAPLLGR
jgi:hypothetical protein